MAALWRFAAACFQSAPAAACAPIAEHGSRGTGAGAQFSSPYGLAILRHASPAADAASSPQPPQPPLVFVCDCFNHRVQALRLPALAAAAWQFGETGKRGKDVAAFAAARLLSSPIDCAVRLGSGADPTGDALLYVLCNSYDAIVTLRAATGAFVSAFKFDNQIAPSSSTPLSSASSSAPSHPIDASALIDGRASSDAARADEFGGAAVGSFIPEELEGELERVTLAAQLASSAPIASSGKNARYIACAESESGSNPESQSESKLKSASSSQQQHQTQLVWVTETGASCVSCFDLGIAGEQRLVRRLGQWCTPGDTPGLVRRNRVLAMRR